MTKESFLTIRWNNLLSLGLGLLVLIYLGIALSTAAWSGQEGFIGISIIGALF